MHCSYIIMCKVMFPFLCFHLVKKSDVLVALTFNFIEFSDLRGEYSDCSKPLQRHPNSVRYRTNQKIQRKITWRYATTLLCYR